MLRAIRILLVLLVASIALGGSSLWLALHPAHASFPAPTTRQVDSELLRTGSPSGEEWVSYSVNWAEQRYSPLTEITDRNVTGLRLRWSYDMPVARQNNADVRSEVTPLVFNGVIYGVSSWSVVFAVEASTGHEIWRQDPEVDQEVWRTRLCCGPVSRGVALYEDLVISAVVDGRLRALDAQTGELIWETRVAPATAPYTITMAPRVIQGGKVIVGVSGGEYGVRGFFSAFDAHTGQQLWRFYTVPGDPSLPFEHDGLKEAAATWSGEWWKIGGGGPVWNSVAYDPEQDLVYVGTGQPAPWPSSIRGPGDDLYTDCILAVRGATGELVWYYQEVPGDDWDYDSVADLMLLDLRIEGRERKVILHAPKNGFFYVLDRVTGEPISADPFTKVSWATGIDPKTGEPIINPDARYGATNSVSVAPGQYGGHVWAPWSYNPETGLVYFPGTAGSRWDYQADEDFVPHGNDLGPGENARYNTGSTLLAADGVSLPEIGPDGPAGDVLFAWDPVARKGAWTAPGAGGGPFTGGSLSTAGNLVFSTVDDRLLGFRADTGEKVLDFAAGLTPSGPPISVMIDGRQHIILTGGPNAPRTIAGVYRWLMEIPQPLRMIALSL